MLVAADDRSFADYKDVPAHEWFVRPTHDGLNDFAALVRSRHAAWRSTASVEDLLCVAWDGLQGVPNDAGEAVLGMACEVAVGCAAADGSPADAATVCLSMPSCERFLSLNGPVLDRAQRLVTGHGARAFLEARSAVMEHRRVRINRILADLNEEMENRLAEALRWVGVEGDLVRQLCDAADADGGRPRVRRARSPNAKAARRAMARSFDLLRSVAGRDRARAWISGDEVVVEGRDLDFRVRVADATLRGHGAVDVSVTDKDRVELASLCVYAPHTPALDQVASLVLHVMAGEEAAVVAAANLIETREAADANAAFMAARAMATNRPAPSRVGPPRTTLDDLADLVRPAVRDALRGHVTTRWAPLVDALGGGLGWITDGMQGIAPARIA